MTSKQTIQGKNALTVGTALLSTLYADATFTLDSFSGSESTMKMIWKIKTNDGSNFSIADTLGIQEKKILYHYSSIQY